VIFGLSRMINVGFVFQSGMRPMMASSRGGAERRVYAVWIYLEQRTWMWYWRGSGEGHQV
jgi:hypothetical protein